MASDKLTVYNTALRYCKERRLATLTDNREARRLLDDAWGDGSTNGAVRHCLELGQWTFATRTGQIDYSPSITPSFGFRYAFDQPTDLVRVAAVCSDEWFKEPLLEYADERHYWYADLQTIYVKWVSNGASYGADMSLWPESFAKFVAKYLAKEVVGSLTGDADEKRVWSMWDEAMKSAKSLDAMNKPTAFMPTGSWVRSRRQGMSRQTPGNGGWSV